MGIKSKAVGLIAAVGLTMSLMVGAAAQENPDSVDGTVFLNGGACGIVATAGTADFGEWTWNGSEWIQGEQNTSVYLTVTTPWTRGDDVSTCALTIGTRGLTLEDGSREAPVLNEGLFRAAVSYPTANDVLNTGRMQPLPATQPVREGDLRVHLDLRTIPADVWAGEYTGTFDFTIGDGQ